MLDLSNLPPALDYNLMNKATDSKDSAELASLSTYPDPHVRARVAENRYTPVEILEKLSDNLEPYAHYVHDYLLRNPELPYHLLHKFINSENKAIRQKALFKILEGYGLDKVALTGEEVHEFLRELAPVDMNNLDFIELLERLHEKKDREEKRKYGIT